MRVVCVMSLLGLAGAFASLLAAHDAQEQSCPATVDVLTSPGSILLQKAVSAPESRVREFQNAKEKYELPEDAETAVMVGGSEHVDGAGEFYAPNARGNWKKSMRYWVQRPEWVRTLRCRNESAESCEPCWGEAECWRRAQDGLIVNADKRAGWARYLVVIHLVCNAPRMNFEYILKSVKEGEVRLYYDNKELNSEHGFRMWSWQSPLKVEWSGKVIDEMRHGVAELKLETAGAHQVTIEFRPWGWGSSAELPLVQLWMPNDFARCEDSKVCLKALKGNEAEVVELRQSNAQQARCLGLPEEEASGACAHWQSCLRDGERPGEPRKAHHATRLKNMLVAAGFSTTNSTAIEKPILLQVGESATTRLEDPCLNPINEDPESWDCDCYENIQKVCREVKNVEGYSDVLCLRAVLCKEEKVCASWKLGKCDGDLLGSLQQALAHADRDAASTIQAAQPVANENARLLERSSRISAVHNGNMFEETASNKRCA